MSSTTRSQTLKDVELVGWLACMLVVAWLACVFVAVESLNVNFDVHSEYCLTCLLLLPGTWINIGCEGCNVPRPFTASEIMDMAQSLDTGARAKIPGSTAMM